MISPNQLASPTFLVASDRREPSQSCPSFQPVLAPDLQARWIDAKALEARTPAWEFLAQHAVKCNPAFESNYLLPALKYLATDSVRVLIVENSNAPEGQEIVAVVPIETKRVYRLPFKAAEVWKSDQCFNTTPLLAKDHAADVWAAVCEFLAADGYSLLSLDTVSAAPEINALFKSFEEKSEVTRFQRDRFQRAGFTPEATADDYYSQHVSKGTRKKVRRHLAKLERIGDVTWERSNEESNFDQLAEDFLLLEASGWKGDNGTALACSESTRSFYKDLVARSAALGKAKFLSLKLDGKLISMISDIQSGSTYYCYKTAYDESFASFSPGLQAEFKNVENLHQTGIEQGDSCTNPGASSTGRVWKQWVDLQNVVFSLKPGLAQATVRALPLAQGAIKRLRNIKSEKVVAKKTKSQNPKPSASAICNGDSATSDRDRSASSVDVNPPVENGDLQPVKLNQDFAGASAAVSSEAIETIADFEAVRGIWEKFAVDPMNSFSWNRSWWQAFQANSKLRLLTFKRAGEIVGIAPFYTDRWFGLTRFRFLATGKTCTDYVDLICAPEDYAICADSLSEYIGEQRFDVVELECPNKDHLTTALTPTLESLYDFDHRDVEPTWLLELSSDWKTFLSERRSSLRRKINKAVRRVESGELTVTSTSKGLSIESGLEILKDLHTRRMNSTDRPGVFADENFEEFLNAAVLDMNAEGKVEIIVASKDDVPIGVQLYFDSSKGFQFYQSGYAPEAMKLEPGHLLFTEMIKTAIARGDTSFDFLRGNEPYKEFWEATPHDQKKLRMISKKWFPQTTARIVETSRRMIRG